LGLDTRESAAGFGIFAGSGLRVWGLGFEV